MLQCQTCYNQVKENASIFQANLLRCLTAKLLTIVLIVPLLFSLSCTQTHQPIKPCVQGAIVDQLHVLQPKQYFIQQTTQELEDYRFGVDPYSQTKHVAAQLSDQLAIARIYEHPDWVFGIGD